MSNQVPIYSHVVPKSHNLRSKPGSAAKINRGRISDTGQFEPLNPSKNGNSTRNCEAFNPVLCPNTGRPLRNTDSGQFDPLNYNHGGNFHLVNVPLVEARHHAAGVGVDKAERRRSKEEARASRRSGSQRAAEACEGKVEAYLRQNQVSIRHQHRHSAAAVRQAEHRVNLRSLPLNEGYTPRGHERTPTDRPRERFGERERDGDARREHRRERDREREAYNVEGSSRNPLSPVVISRINQHAEQRVRKSSSAQRLEQPTFGGVTRRFYCREWAFQKLAHCLEQRPVSKTCGALVLGDSGSGKTALCRELTQPGGGPQARQQRALNRRLLASHFMQGDNENSLRTGQFVRSLAARLLAHSSRHRGAGAPDSPLKQQADSDSPDDGRRHGWEEELPARLRETTDDGEDSSKPLLADSEDQRTDEEEPAMMRDAPLSAADELPEMLPRACKPSTNPFLTDDRKETDFKIYENHENVFLRNISQRQSKELRNSRLLRQSSEPLTDKKANVLQKSHSIDPKADSTSSENENRDKPQRNVGENGSPTNAKISRIPVANFRYPNKSGLGSSSENSPNKSKPANANQQETKEKDVKEEQKETQKAEDIPAEKEEELEQKEEIQTTEDLKQDEDELPEYQNILKPRNLASTFESEDPQTPDLEILLEKKRSQTEDVPPPIPSLPVSPRTLIANAYYEKLISEPEIQQSLLPHNLEKNPDECFKKAFLFPLLEIDPPKQCLFLLVDSLDEGALTGPAVQSKDGEGRIVSRTVAELLANHHHLFPQWLLLVCTARKQSKSLTKMFTGFRKIALDELQRAHVSADVQRYVLARLDGEPRLRARVSSDAAAAAAAAAALDHLRIKSDGCLLYLEKVLDGIADGFIALREIREIPGTLNGLYLWLAQRIFHGRRFAKVRLMLDVLLAARCGVTEEMLYKCLLTNNYSLTRDDFNRRLHLLRRIVVVDQTTGFLSVFHHSFCSWLVDVKHCTRRYLCCPPLGHAALAMYYTLEAKRLSALEIQNYALHMTRLEQHLTAQRKNKDKCDEPLDLHTLTLLWIVDSGCRAETALRTDATTAQPTMTGILEQEENEKANENADDAITSPKAPARADAEWVPSFISSLYCPTLAHDARVVRCLVELGARPEPGTLPREHSAEVNIADEEDALEITASQMSLERQRAREPAEGSECAADAPAPAQAQARARAALDEHTVAHQLAQRGDDERLQSLLETWPELVEALDTGGGTPLHAAARHGRAGCSAALLRAGARPDAADADGWSPLRAAAWAGHTEVVEVLLEHGCQVDCVDSDNRTALRAAAWSGHEAVVGLLLGAGAAADRADGEGRTPLIAAAYMGHADIVRALLDAGADVDHADEDGRTALSVASLCSTGAQCAALLLERGADVTKADRDKATPLLVAAFEGHTEICELLLEHEADPEACDAAGRTALWAAASAGHARAVRLLLFWGACVDNMDAEGRTVLSVAAAQGNVEVVRQLLDRGLDEHHRDNAGWTPLHYAAFEGHVEVCESLLEAGAKVDEADNDGKGALMLAAQEGHTRLIEILIDDWGAPVDQHAHDGKTALRAAALEGHVECVGALRARGADVDALDADRRSTLYVLALDNRLIVARYLVRQCGASVDTRDTEGRTPLHVSAWQGHTDMVNMLIKLGGAEVDGRDRCMRTALHAAAWRGRAAVLRTLLQHGADPAAVCTQGATPLGIAAQEGHEECVMWLLQHGADPLQADHCGRTPAKVAWRAGHAGVCRLLERWSTPSAPAAPAAPAACAPAAPHDDTDTSGSTAETRACTAALVCPVTPHRQGSPELKRRSVHSSNSTKSSSNLTAGSGVSADTGTVQQKPDAEQQQEKRAALGLSFAQQVARCGRGQRARRREPPRDAEPPLPERNKDARLRSYIANEHDGELRGYVRERDRYRHSRDGDTSPLYASPPRSPISDICSPTRPHVPFGSPQPLQAAPAPAPSAPPAPAAAAATATDQHFARDTHMRIILGRDERSSPALNRDSGKSKRNGIVTNPAMRLVANVRNGLDHAAANIRRTGVALAASAGASNPAVKTDAFQWRRETPL